MSPTTSRCGRWSSCRRSRSRHRARSCAASCAIGSARRLSSELPLPDTPALAALVAAGLEHQVVRTRRPRSMEEAAELRGIPVGSLLKTLVVRRSEGEYVFVLVPGDREIDWPKLRSHLGERRLSLPDAEEARGATGYERGAITPFGATSAWPVVADATIPDKGMVSLGGGAHGVSVKLDAATMLEVLDAVVADVTKPTASHE